MTRSKSKVINNVKSRRTSQMPCRDIAKAKQSNTKDNSGNKPPFNLQAYSQSKFVSSNTRSNVLSKFKPRNTNHKQSKWTKEEDLLLMRLCRSKLDRKWLKISQIIGSKNQTQCAYRYKKLASQLKENGMSLDQGDEDILLNDERIFKQLKKSFDHKENRHFQSQRNRSSLRKSYKRKRKSLSRSKGKIKEKSQSRLKRKSNENTSPCSELGEGFILTQIKSSSTNLVHQSSLEEENQPNKTSVSIIDTPNVSIKTSFEYNNFPLNYTKSLDTPLQIFNSKMRSGSHASQTCFLDYQLKKDSGDFFNSAIRSKNKEASQEFKREFIKNFHRKNEEENEPDGEFSIAKNENVQMINQIKASLNAEIVSNIHMNYTKLCQLLSLTHYITNSHITKKEELKVALVLQEEILKKMIAILENHINT